MMFIKWGGTNGIYSTVQKRTEYNTKTTNGDYYKAWHGLTIVKHFMSQSRRKWV